MDISDLSTRQVANALIIFGAAVPFGADAVKGALMAAAAESSFMRYANDGSTTRADVAVKWRQLAATSMNYPHDAVAGSAWTTADSVGLFQQRAMYGYGTIAELMDPAESARIFIRGSQGGTGRTRYFMQAPKDLSLAAKVQWTQGSEFPTGDNYMPMETVADQLISHFGGVKADPVTLPEEEWIDMADQAKLDEFSDQVAGKTAAKVQSLLVDPNITTAQNRALFAQDTGAGASYAQQIAEQTRLLQAIAAKLGA